MSRLPPEYLIIICEFTYASLGKTRYIPNEVRRFLAGEAHQVYEKKRPGLPERIAKKFESKVLVPLHFSLIKHPIKIDGRTYNAAVGAIMIYMITRANWDTFRQVCNAVREELQKRFKNFEILAGHRVEVEH